jgi:hypothetical protein
MGDTEEDERPKDLTRYPKDSNFHSDIRAKSRFLLAGSRPSLNRSTSPTPNNTIKRIVDYALIVIQNWVLGEAKATAGQPLLHPNPTIRRKVSFSLILE